jgi:hypothetical protein
VEAGVLAAGDEVRHGRDRSPDGNADVDAHRSVCGEYGTTSCGPMSSMRR